MGKKERKNSFNPVKRIPVKLTGIVSAAMINFGHGHIRLAGGRTHIIPYLDILSLSVDQLSLVLPLVTNSESDLPIPSTP